MTRSRFVVLYHHVGPRLDRTAQPHCDWMFALKGQLRTWATPPVTRFDEPLRLSCTPLPDHRIDYLDFEGELSHERGTVRRLLHGTAVITHNSPNRFGVELSWDESGGAGGARLWIQRSAVAADSASPSRLAWSLWFEPRNRDSGW